LTPRLIFDIETVGVEFDFLDKKSKEFLLINADSEEKINQIKEELGFSPLTGQVVAIGIMNPDTDKGAVYYQSPSGKVEKQSDDEKTSYIACADEKELLKGFWDAAAHYNQFITFAGHVFDCPYLMVRSAVNNVKPTQLLLQNRYNSVLHLDLLDRLTNFGAMRGKRSLHLWCQAFGIGSSKDKGVTGDDVSRLFKEKKYLDIARYCYDDVKATRELFWYWEKYFK
jgi:DNA polymerase elongation subunit (family B)